jgi:DNA repair protein SbcD/Mre11
MSTIKFIHCADLHIDSPFKGISEVNEELRDILYNSTFQSFKNIVDLAIENQVHAMLIAGDIYDGADKSLKAQLRFREELTRLSDKGIPSFIVAGNHDPLDSWSASIEWPEGVHFFGGEKVEKYPLTIEGDAVAEIYGISFPKQNVTDNLALQFDRENDKIPAIAILHTNIGENTGHKSYAPATIEDLKSRKMDYWALGHVHTQKMLNENQPVILYPGNTQARNPREPGSKGCTMVTMEKDGSCQLTHHATDVVRYKSVIVDVSSTGTIDEVIETIKTECNTVSSEMDGRHVIVRIALQGRTSVNEELRKGNNLLDILESTREYFSGSTPVIWLEKIGLDTAGAYDIETLRQGKDFIADIISLYDDSASLDAERINDIREFIKPVTETWAGSKHLEIFTEEEIAKLIEKARDWTLDQMVGE